MGNAVSMACFMKLFWHLSGRAKKKHEYLVGMSHSNG
jgi:hypothetical protein